MSEVRAPLFRDPVFDGAADPVVTWNASESSWWMFYTARRALVEGEGYAWVHGSDIGMASSRDGGATWLYRGTAQGLEFEPGRNTFWAPEIVSEDGVFHMYVSYVQGIPSTWNFPRSIVHYTSADCWTWSWQSRIVLSSDRVIDPCVHRLPDGRWRMWYKDETAGGHTYAADSEDLFRWSVRGPVITDCAHEGPNVFRWKERYWMITDHWRGLGVYSSEDADTWTRQADILQRPGRRPDDGNVASHADVVVQGERAYIFYFVQPGMTRTSTLDMPSVMPFEMRRSSIQAAELELSSGTLVCDRERAFVLALDEPSPEG